MGHKILLIDDDPRVLMTFSRNLRAEGYAVDSAASGREGLQHYRENRPDIVLLDVRMPDMDGFAVLHEIRRLDTEAEVILVTGHGDVDVAISALRAGASDFITKPVISRDLQAALQRAEERLRLKGALQRAQEIVRASESKLRALLEYAPVGVVVVDEMGHIVMVNARMIEMFGYRKEEMLGRQVEMLLPEEVRAAHAAYREAFLRHPVSRSMGTSRALRATRKDGSTFPVEVGLSVADVPAGGQLIASYIIDITQQQLAAATLMQAKEAAEDANRAKGLFLANINHELRTPLNAILGFTQLMLHDSDLSQDQREDLTIIIRSGEHLLSLINDVLDFTKIEAGQVALHNVAFDLYRMLDDIEDMLRIKAEGKGLYLILERDADVPRYISADELKLRQILINLLNNAIKFTEVGGIILRVQSVSAEDGPRIALGVQDTGPGILPEELAALFEVFVQAEAGRRAREGTGLGLPISREFVRLMGGELSVFNQPGEGAYFTFDVPVKVVDATAVPAPRKSRRVVGLRHTAAPDGGDTYRVLIADSDSITRELLVRLLAPLGFAVRAAEDGAAALAQVEQWQPHLVLLDTSLSVMAHAQVHPGARAPKWIALAMESPLTCPVGEAAPGYDGVLAKPFRQAELFDVLAAYLPVEFVYEAAVTAAPPPPLIRISDLASRMRELEPVLCEQLQQAVLRTDIHRVTALIRQVQARDKPLAEALLGMAERFDYSRILAVLQTSKEGTG